MALTTAQIQQAYVAFFNRPADVAGLNYWSQYPGSLSDLYATFAQQPEYADSFGNLTSVQKVNAVYLNLLNRNAELDPAGLEYWALKLDTGAITLANLTLAIIAGAQGSDIETIANKVTAATAFTNALDTSPEVLAYSGADANSAAREWLSGVTDDASLAAAIAPAALDASVAAVIEVGGLTGETLALTTETDNIAITTLNTIDTVTGVQATTGGTYNPGDRIVGNGNTVLDLILASGAGVAALVKNVAEIKLTNLVAGTATVQGFGFSDVGSITVVDGVNGGNVFVDNLASGIAIGIEEVSGTISASYDLGDTGLFASLDNNDRGGMGGTLVVDADNNVDVTLANSVSGYIRATDDITLGDVTVAGGDVADFSMYFSVNGDVTVGDVMMTAGDGASLDVSVNTASGDLLFGDIMMTAGNSSSLEVEFSDVSGDLTVGDISLTAGDSSDLSISITDNDGPTTVGDITLVGGNDVSADIDISTTASTTDDGSITVGNVSVTVGDTSDISITIEADNGDVTVGDLTMVGGNTATADAYISSTGTLANITVGDVMVTLGDGGESGTGYASVSIDNSSNNNVGNLTVGNVDMTVGDNNEAWFFAFNYANAATTVDNTGNAAGNLTVGDVTLAAGNELGADTTTGNFSDVTAQFYVYNEAWGAAGQIAGDVSIGDVTVTVGDGFVSGTVENEAEASVTINNWGYAGMGDLMVGNVSLNGGDFADLSLSVTGYANSGYATVGDMSIGDVGFNAGESAYISMNVSWYADSSGDVGSLTLGDVTVNAAQDASVDLSVYQAVSSAASTTANILGDLTVGNVDVLLGDNANVTIDIQQYATYDSMTDAVDGDVMIGDITVAVSATTTDALSGGSFIDVNISKSAWNDDGATGGSFTLGDVSLSAGDAASISLDINVEGSFAQMGDVSVGVISLAAGDDAVNVYANLYVSNNTSGNIGNVSIGGLDVTLGDNSDADVEITIDKNDYSGTMGNFSLGDVNLSVGTSSTIEVNLDFSSFTTTGNAVGNISVGDINVVVGESGSVDLVDLDIEVSDSIGNVTIGDVNADIGVSADFYFSPSISSSNDTIGNVTIGNLDATLAESGYLSYSANINGNDGVGDVTVGNLSVVAGTSATVDYLAVSVTADSGSVGHVAVGNISIDLGAGATVGAGWNAVYVTASNDIDGVTIGDLSVTLGEGAGGTQSITADAGGSAGDMIVGDISIIAENSWTTANTATADVGSSYSLDINQTGATSDTLTLGDISVDVAGTHVDDEVWLYVSGAGDVTLGDVTISGEGEFNLDNAVVTTATADNVSFLNVTAGGDITIGNVDFSGYENDAIIDLSWTDAGAANITGSAQDDIIIGNVDDNVIVGGEGQDDITLGGGVDTIVFNDGDTGITLASIDTVTGWGSTDKLDFNYVAATAGNYVEGTGSTDLADFIANANDALNSTVKYFVDSFGGNTYVAVNTTSGDVEQIVELVGVTTADIAFANIIA